MTDGGYIYQFGPFRLDPAAGILYRGAEPTMLGRRAVALLRQLLENARVPVSKDALVEAGWGGLAVAELHPTFRYSRQFAGVNCAPALAAILGDALRTAGLPE